MSQQTKNRAGYEEEHPEYQFPVCTRLIHVYNERTKIRRFHVAFLRRGKRFKCVRFSEAGFWKGQPSIHAERNSMRASSFKPRKAKCWTMVSLRIRVDLCGDLHLLFARPCKHCCRAIHEFGIKKIIFSTRGGFEKTSPTKLMKFTKRSSGWAHHER